MSTEEMKNKARAAADTAKEIGRDAVSDAAAKATEAAKGTASAMREQAEVRAENAKDTLADEGKRFADTLRNAAENDGSLQARLLDVVAGSVADASEGLRGRSLGSLIGDVETFARRNPGAFVAGATLAGFAIARFARASDQRPNEPESLPVPAPVYGAGGAERAVQQAKPNSPAATHEPARPLATEIPS